MAMSRKHYTEVAAILKYQIAVYGEDKSTREAVQEIASDLADFFKRDNGNFDRIKFMEAAGL